jgi:hypothetical protein
MSIYINGDKKGLRRTANLPTSCANFTACGFIKVVNASPGREPHVFFGQSAGGGSGETLFLTSASGLDLKAGDNWGSSASPTVATLTAGGGTGTNWQFVGIRGTAAGAGGLKATHKPVGSGSIAHQTVTNTPGAVGFDAIQLGDLPFGTAYWGDMLLAHWMIYDRALSDAEMLTQSAQAAPASGTNLISYHSFTNSDVNVAVVPDTGDGTWSFFTSAPIMSTDNPVFSANPIFSGSATLPSTLAVAVGGGLPPIIFNYIRK